MVIHPYIHLNTTRERFIRKCLASFRSINPSDPSDQINILVIPTSSLVKIQQEQQFTYSEKIEQQQQQQH